MCAALVRFAELNWRLALATVLILLLPLSASISYGARLPSAPNAAPIVVPLPEVAADVWQSRGHVVHQEPYDPPLDDRDSVLGQAWRAVYSSVSGVDGGRREVSGAFFIPRGTPPKNGWPVISLAHGTTGIGHDCGPSREPNFMSWYAPMIQSFLADKYAVALTDYEGLGESGSHPYLEPRTAAFNTIDAVRAIRDISATVSARWMAVGYSQGGQAVWAADELNSYYGNDLQLQGSVALAPAANLTGVADLVWSGSMTADQRALFPLGIVGFARYNPGLNEDAFLHGSAEFYREQLSRCVPTDSQESTGSHSEDTPLAPVPWQPVVVRLREANEVKPDTPQDVAKLRDALRRVALPQRPPDKPMLVINGEDDTQVLPDWVRSAVSRSCALGGRIEYQQVPNVGHNDLVPKVGDTVERWIADRFAGTTAPSNCPAGLQ